MRPLSPPWPAAVPTTVVRVDEATVSGAELVEACAGCGRPATAVVSEAVDGGRIAWAVSIRCDWCGGATELDGWGEMPALVRAALVARVGLARVRADPVSSRPLRVVLLGVFRGQGATITEAGSAFTALTGGGVSGTPAEMRLLAERLNAAGATVSLTPIPPA